jgi:putative membrane protein
MAGSRRIPYIVAPVAESKNWFSFLKNAHKTSTFRQLFLSMVAIGFYTALLDYVLIELLNIPNITPIVHQILGITLGLMLVIRTNTSYDRWWEGRRVVGSLTNSSRNLALELNAFLPPEDKETRYRFAGLIATYFYSLKEHLRQGVKFEELEDVNFDTLQILKKAYHVPNRVAQLIYDDINEIYQKKVIDGYQFISLVRKTEDFTDVVGACERIKKTPLPKAYSMHLKFFILVYISTLPIGIIHELRYWTIPATMLIFYAMVGMELIGEEIEDPFGKDENDIPMDSICNNVRHNVFEILIPETTEMKSQVEDETDLNQDLIFQST